MSPLIKTICIQIAIAFGIQTAVMILPMALGIVPALRDFFRAVTGLLTLPYIPSMALVEALKLFPRSDGPLKWFVGWFSGAIVYSLFGVSLGPCLSRRKSHERHPPLRRLFRVGYVPAIRNNPDR